MPRLRASPATRSQPSVVAFVPSSPTLRSPWAEPAEAGPRAERNSPARASNAAPRAPAGTPSGTNATRRARSSAASTGDRSARECSASTTAESSELPASATPPPSTMTSGSTVWAIRATAPARCPATSSRISAAIPSPAAAAASSADAADASPSPADHRRPLAVPQATASRHPRWPHSHSGPPGATGRCPISPAAPCAPRRILPPSRNPAATPVPTLRYARSPVHDSAAAAPTAAAFTSLSTTTSAPVSRPRCSAKGRGSSPRPRLTACRTLPAPRSTRPGMPTPTAAKPSGATPAASATASRAPVIEASTTIALPMFVGRRTVATIDPSTTARPSSAPSSGSPGTATAAASVFVPPTSRPATTISVTGYSALPVGRAGGRGRGWGWSRSRRHAAQRLTRLGVEQVELVGVDGQLDRLTGGETAAGAQPRHRPPPACYDQPPGVGRIVSALGRVGHRHVDHELPTECLDQVDGGLDHPVGGYSGLERHVGQRLGPHADDHP